MSVSSAEKFQNLSATDATLVIPCGGYGTVGIQLAGTWAGTFTFEGTVDHGTWQTLNVALTNSSTQVTTATGNGIWRGSCAGLLAVRVRFSIYTSGIAQVRLLVAGASSGGGASGGGAGSDVNLIEVGGASIALGQAVMAASVPVVIASNQTAIPVTGTFSDTSVGPTGDPVPADAQFQGFENPSGDLEGEKKETFDLDLGAGTDPTTASGLKFGRSGGGVAVGDTTPLPVGGNTVKDGTGTPLAFLVDADGHQQVDVLSSALPTGASTLAEQQTQTTALQIIDDWDESDRAKVNPIVGQAGVQGGAGAVSANTQRIAIATDANAVANPALTDIGAGEYETVAASQTAQVLGTTGAIGDFLAGLLVTPATTSPGNVIILDNATSITVFTGGASSVSNLVPFFIPLGIKSVSGAWKVTTGANVSCIGVGNFT